MRRCQESEIYMWKYCLEMHNLNLFKFLSIFHIKRNKYHLFIGGIPCTTQILYNATIPYLIERMVSYKIREYLRKTENVYFKLISKPKWTQKTYFPNVVHIHSSLHTPPYQYHHTNFACTILSVWCNLSVIIFRLPGTQTAGTGRTVH